MLSRANHGADEANKPANIIAHTPVAITMLRPVILIADTSCLTALLQNTIYHPVAEGYRDQALQSSTCPTLGLSPNSLDILRIACHTRHQPKPLRPRCKQSL